MEEKRRFKASINGKEYTIVGKKSAQHLNTVVDMINNQLEQLKELDQTLSVADRSILMAINAVSDQLSQEQYIMELESRLEELQSLEDASQQTSLFPNDDGDRGPRVPFKRQ